MDTATYAAAAVLPWSVAQSTKRPIGSEADLAPSNLFLMALVEPGALIRPLGYEFPALRLRVALCRGRVQTGVPAASLRKFTLVYCTQDQPLSSAVRVAAQRTPTPRSLAEECGCRKHEESSACKGPFNLPGRSRPDPQRIH